MIKLDPILGLRSEVASTEILETLKNVPLNADIYNRTLGRALVNVCFLSVVAATKCLAKAA